MSRAGGAAAAPELAIVLVLALLLVLAGCTNPASTMAPVVLRVGVAASLRTVAEALADQYAGAHPGVTVEVTADSSAALRAQIEQGNPIDVFLSADTDNPRRLLDDGLTIGDPAPFAANTIALIVPPGNPASIASPVDLARPGVRIVAAGERVPITRYADEVVRKLGELPGYPGDFAAAVAANVVSREDNVGAVRVKVALGEADAGFVYATDATGQDVVGVPIPSDAGVRAEYQGVVVAGSAHPETAAEFLAWVAGPAGRGILAAHGFLAP